MNPPDDIHFKNAAEARIAHAESKATIASMEDQLRSPVSPTGHLVGTRGYIDWRRKIDCKLRTQRIKHTAITFQLDQLKEKEKKIEGSAESLIDTARPHLFGLFDGIKHFEDELHKATTRIETLEEENARLREENADLRVRWDDRKLSKR